MTRWNWFLAADYEGQWITTAGYAEVTLRAGSLHAQLRYSPEVAVYQELAGPVGPDGAVRVVVRSPDGGAPPFDLQGQVYRGSGTRASTTILLTDGTTVLGLAHGPRSRE